jgi:hypothetical protein
MTTNIKSKRIVSEKLKLPLQGWIGFSLIIVFWALNWTLQGARTHWGFFPLWLGYCLAMDGLVYWRTGTSLLTRSPRKYIGLFLISAPVWWIFELFNVRTQNWTYIGADIFSPFEYAFWTTVSFTTVIPAVFGSAEFFASFPFVKRLPRGPVVGTDQKTTLLFFTLGWIMLALMLLWPQIFFPFIWLSLYFILEPVNIWMGNRSLAHWTQHGDWRPIVSLWLGVLLAAFFWEMWNYYSYPKWVYYVPWGGWLHVFEMPLPGYTGYLPFALELYALYHCLRGLFGDKRTDYIKVISE